MTYRKGKLTPPAARSVDWGALGARVAWLAVRVVGLAAAVALLWWFVASWRFEGELRENNWAATGRFVSSLFAVGLVFASAIGVILWLNSGKAKQAYERYRAKLKSPVVTFRARSMDGGALVARIVQGLYWLIVRAVVCVTGGVVFAWFAASCLVVSHHFWWAQVGRFVLDLVVLVGLGFMVLWVWEAGPRWYHNAIDRPVMRERGEE